MVMIASLFVAALAGIASAAPTGYSGSSSSSSSYGSSSGSGSSGYGSSSYDSSSSGSSGYGSSSSSNYGSSGYGSSGSYGSGSDSSSSSTATELATSTSTTAYSTSTSYSTPSYGSGSSSWNSGSSYDSCVQQCVAQFGQPSSMGSYEAPTATMGSTGTGATHTVIVAPTQGVLRYVPFAVNASVGDTVEFHWLAGPHTVTKSSVLDVCNKTSDAPFASGIQNASFVFNQVINDTNPTFYYCGVPTHCQKGMFGIINPPNAVAQPSSVDNMVYAIAANNSATAAAWAVTKNYTGAAATWGGSIDLSGMDSWAQSAMVENVLYMRSFIAANPSVVNENGEINLTNADMSNMMIPADIAAQALAASSSTASTSGAPNAPAVASAASSPAASASATGTVSNAASANGAGALASPRVGVALIAVAAAFFAL